MLNGSTLSLVPVVCMCNVCEYACNKLYPLSSHSPEKFLPSLFIPSSDNFHATSQKKTLNVGYNQAEAEGRLILI